MSKIIYVGSNVSCLGSPEKAISWHINTSLHLYSKPVLHIRGGSMGARQTKGKDFYITIVIKQHVSTCMGCCTVAKLLVLYSSACCLISWSSTPLVLRKAKFLWLQHVGSQCFPSEYWALGKFAWRTHKIVIANRWWCCDNLTFCLHTPPIHQHVLSG